MVKIVFSYVPNSSPAKFWGGGGGRPNVAVMSILNARACLSATGHRHQIQPAVAVQNHQRGAAADAAFPCYEERPVSSKHCLVQRP